MAWRIDEQVIRGEIDNRTCGQVTGRIWLIGREEPVELDLKGDAWHDLAGHLLRFSNPDPKPADLSGLNARQRGVVGDITASRKVRVPEVPMEDLMDIIAARADFPWHWANSLYLEWFSAANGRVVIESVSYQLDLDGEPAWIMTDADEAECRRANGQAMASGAGLPNDDDEDEPTTVAESEADEEDARMQLLLDRVGARIEREGPEEADFDLIHEEERARLKRERGGVEPELTPGQEEERARWIEEMNAICEQALSEAGTDKWKDDSEPTDDRHPLVISTCDFAVELRHDLQTGGWLPADANQEHPLQEIADGVMIAGVKLGGALGMADKDQWPPDPIIAGNALVRLKKARAHLCDALAGLDAAAGEALATPSWRARASERVNAILADVRQLISEARGVLEDRERGL